MRLPLRISAVHLVSLALVAACLFLITASAEFVVDDAYISFTYSRNLVEGNGATYNGMWVEGYSNPLWVILITPFISLGIDPLLGARALSIASVLITLYLVLRLIDRLYLHKSIHSLGVTALMLVSNSALISWTTSGMETTLAMMFVTLIVYLETDTTRNRLLPSAFAVTGLVLTRPEGMMLIPILLVFHVLRRGYGWRSQLSWALLVVALIGLLIAARLAIYGYPLPNTAYVKVPGQLIGETLSAGITYTSRFFLLRPVLTLLLLGALVGLLKRWRQVDSAWLLILAIIGGYAAFAVYVGGDWMPFHRFLVPVIPLVTLLAGKALDFDPERKRQQYLVIGAGAGFVIVELLLWAVFYRPVYAELNYHQNGSNRAGVCIRENTPEDAVIAVVDAGALAYYSERTVIDIIGLNNVHIAHQGSDPDYVLAQEPLLIQLHVARTDEGELYDPHSAEGNALIQHPTFLANYAPLFTAELRDCGAGIFERITPSASAEA